MKLAIISECGLVGTHGVGAQTLRVFVNSGIPFFHLYFAEHGFGASECKNSYRLEDRRWPARGKRMVYWIRRLMGATWWEKDKINKTKFQRLIDSRRLNADVAYVTVANENMAMRAVSLLRSLRCPYVVHLWDLYHHQGLEPDSMPGFQDLLENASSVLVLSDAIREEVIKFNVSDIENVVFCNDVAVPVAKAPTPGETIRVAVVGMPFEHGMDILAGAIPGLHRVAPRLEFIYLGRYFDSIPESCRPVVRKRGYVSDDEYRKVLGDCHIAFLTGPFGMGYFDRYSIPSRLSDFLMAGLPVLACVGSQGATERLLAPLEPLSVRFTRESSQLVEGIGDFTASVARWDAASQKARSFAVQNFDVCVIRKRIAERLSEACAKTQLPTKGGVSLQAREESKG